jgi:hypothetical protein
MQTYIVQTEVLEEESLAILDNQLINNADETLSVCYRFPNSRAGTSIFVSPARREKDGRVRLDIRNDIVYVVTPKRGKITGKRIPLSLVNYIFVVEDDDWYRPLWPIGHCNITA